MIASTGLRSVLDFFGTLTAQVQKLGKALGIQDLQDTPLGLGFQLCIVFKNGRLEYVELCEHLSWFEGSDRRLVNEGEARLE